MINNKVSRKYVSNPKATIDQIKKISGFFSPDDVVVTTKLIDLPEIYSIRVICSFRVNKRILTRNH